MNQQLLYRDPLQQLIAWVATAHPLPPRPWLTALGAALLAAMASYCLAADGWDKTAARSPMASTGVHYYVSQATGDDAADGSVTTPWRTISKAAGIAQPGDVVHVLAGTYDESIAPPASVAANPAATLFYAESIDDVIVTNVGNSPLRLNGCRNFVFDGFVFLKQNGINVTLVDSSATFRTCQIREGVHGIHAVNSALTLHNSFVSNQGNYGVLGATSTLVISQCSFVGAVLASVALDGTSPDTHQVTMTNCHCYGVPGSTRQTARHVQVADAAVHLDGGRFEVAVSHGVHLLRSRLTHANAPVLTGNAVAIGVFGNASDPLSFSLTIADLTIENNYSMGIQTQDCCITVNGCTIRNNGQFGVSFVDGQLDINDTTIDGHSKYGVDYRATNTLTRTGHHLALGNCSFSENRVQAIVSNSPATLTTAMTVSDCEFSSTAAAGRTGIEVTGVTLSLTSSSISGGEGTSVWIQDGGAIIESCQLTDSLGSGVDFKDLRTSVTMPASLTIRDCLISGHRFFGVRSEIASTFTQPHAVQVIDSDIRDCQSGIWLRRGSLSCTNATISGHEEAGIDLAFSSVAFVNMPPITSNAKGMIVSEPPLAGGAIDFTDVILSENSEIGLLVEHCTCVMRQSTCENNGTHNVQATDSAVLTLIDCLVAGAGVSGVQADQADVTLVGCEIKNNGVFGVVSYGADDGMMAPNSVTVDDTLIKDSGDTGVAALTTNVTIRNQSRIDGGPFGVQIWNQSSGSGESMCAVEITDSEVKNCGAYGVLTSYSQSMVLRRSVIRDGQGIGVSSWGDTAVTVDRVEVRGNADIGAAIYGGTASVVNSLFARNGEGVVLANDALPLDANVRNVTIADNQGQFGLLVNGATVTLTNSILYRNGAFGLARNAGAITHTFNMVFGHTNDLSNTARGASEWFIDPKFVDADAADYHLSLPSRAINRGTTAADIVIDLDGIARPTFNRWELGCYEFVESPGVRYIDAWTEKR